MTAAHRPGFNVFTAAADTAVDVNEIVRICATTREVSFRPAADFEAAVREGRLIVATADARVIGWCLRIEHTPTVQELASVFVHTRWRRQGVLDALIELAVSQRPWSVGMTRSRWLAAHLSERFGFHRVRATEIMRLTRGGIARDRLRPGRLRHLRSFAHGEDIVWLALHTRNGEAERSDGRWSLDGQCPTCGCEVDALMARDWTFGTGTAYRYLRCGHCRSVGLDDSAGQAVLNDGDLPFVRRVMDHKVVSRLIYRPRAAWLGRRGTLGPRTIALDVGCGTGGFITALAVRTGSTSIRGVDVEPGLVAAARRRGLDVREANADEDLPADDGDYDLITMFHVVEHLKRPRQAVASAYERLRPGGALCVEVPVSDAAGFRVFRQFWLPLLPGAHRQLLSRQEMRSLLLNCCPSGTLVAERPVMLPGEHAASLLLPLSRWLPHPLRHGRSAPIPAAAAGIAMIPMIGLGIAIETVAALMHTQIPCLAGHHRFLIRKAG